MISKVFEEYRQTRRTELSKDEFTQMLPLVPVLIVATADQNVDNMELGYLTGLVHELTLEFDRNLRTKEDVDRLKNQYLEELSYLLRNMRYWEEKLLTALFSLLERDTDMRRRLRIRMQAVAESSQGVNSYERQKLDELIQKLGLEL